MDGYTTTMFERHQPSELASSNFMQRHSVNVRSARRLGDCGYHGAMIRWKRPEDAEWMRDHLAGARRALVECAAREAEKAKLIIHNEMVTAADVKVPLSGSS